MKTSNDHIVWQFEHSVECKVTRSFVWSFWTKVSNWEKIEGEAVEWIKISGPFAVGTSGSTKPTGQDAHSWEITQLDPGRSATIEIRLDSAVFTNEMMMESTGPDRTRITQVLGLYGKSSHDFVEGMRVFETTAPQGLLKLANTLESEYDKSIS